MKKYLAVFLAVAVVVSLSACAKKTEPSPSPSVTTAEPSVSPAASASPKDLTAAEYLAGEPTAPELGAYLKENAARLSPEDGDLLLERLLLLQLDISSDMNMRIWDAPYMTALSDTLGGILNAEKIPDITDAAVKSNFQRVSDSLMTIVRYEETPVFEPDWAALESIGEAFSTQTAFMVEFRSRLQGRYYYGDPYNFDLLAADIAATEHAYQNTGLAFVRWQLAQLYSVQVGRMLYGPEGSYLSMFTSGDAQIVSNIKKYAEQYTGTGFGAICRNMLMRQGDGEQAVSSYISDSLIFPPGDARRMTELSINYNGARLAVPQIMGMTDKTVMEKLNASILNAAKALIKSGRTEQKVSGYISFASDAYININLTYSYIDESETDRYFEAYMMQDMKSGEKITLDELVGRPLEAYKGLLLQSIINGNAPKDLTAPVSFMLDRKELIITIPSAKSDWPDYYTVTYNGLRSFMDVSKLY